MPRNYVQSLLASALVVGYVAGVPLLERIPCASVQTAADYGVSDDKRQLMSAYEQRASRAAGTVKAVRDAAAADEGRLRPQLSHVKAQKAVLDHEKQYFDTVSKAQAALGADCAVLSNSFAQAESERNELAGAITRLEQQIKDRKENLLVREEQRRVLNQHIEAFKRYWKRCNQQLDSARKNRSSSGGGNGGRGV